MSIYTKNDIQDLTSQFKQSLQQCIQDPNPTNMMILSRTMDCVGFALTVMKEELIQKNQLEILQLRLSKWPDCESKQCVTRSLKSLMGGIKLNIIEYVCEAEYFIIYMIIISFEDAASFRLLLRVLVIVYKKDEDIVRMMRKFIHVLQLNICTLAVLEVLKMLCRSQREILLECGVLGVLLGLLNREQEVVGEALQLVNQVCRDDSECIAVVEDFGVSLLDILSRYYEDCAIYGVIQQLVGKMNRQQEISLVKVDKYLVSAMSSKAIRYASELWFYSFKPLEATISRAIETLVRLIEKELQSPRVVEVCFRALYNLPSSNVLTTTVLAIRTIHDESALYSTLPVLVQLQLNQLSHSDALEVYSKIKELPNHKNKYLLKALSLLKPLCSNLKQSQYNIDINQLIKQFTSSQPNSLQKLTNALRSSTRLSTTKLDISSIQEQILLLLREGSPQQQVQALGLLLHSNGPNSALIEAVYTMATLHPLLVLQVLDYFNCDVDVNVIFSILDAAPFDQEIIQLAGVILRRMGVHHTIDSRINDFQKKQDSQSTSNLSNCIVACRQDEVSEQVVALIEQSKPFSKEMLILISRLAVHMQNTIRESSIGKELVDILSESRGIDVLYVIECLRQIEDPLLCIPQAVQDSIISMLSEDSAIEVLLKACSVLTQSSRLRISEQCLTRSDLKWRMRHLLAYLCRTDEALFQRVCRDTHSIEALLELSPESLVYATILLSNEWDKSHLCQQSIPTTLALSMHEELLQLILSDALMKVDLPLQSILDRLVVDYTHLTLPELRSIYRNIALFTKDLKRTRYLTSTYPQHFGVLMALALTLNDPELTSLAEEIMMSIILSSDFHNYHEQPVVLNHKCESIQNVLDLLNSKQYKDLIVLQDDYFHIINDSIEQVATSLESMIMSSDFNVDRAIRLIRTTRAFAVDNQSASRVHDLGITKCLIKLMDLVDQIPKQIDEENINCLAHVLSFRQSVKTSRILMYEAYRSYMKHVSDNLVPFLRVVKYSAPLEDMQAKLVGELEIVNVAHLVMKWKSLPGVVVAGSECLERLGVDERVLGAYFDNGVVDFILEQMVDDSLLEALCLLIGTVCKCKQAQTYLNSRGTYEHIVRGLSRYSLANLFYALSGLAFNSPTTATQMSILCMQSIVDALQVEQVPLSIAETACSLISNLTFKNDVVKKKFGEQGVVTILIEIWSRYMYTYGARTLRQVLRAIGNVCYLWDNGLMLIRSEFFPLSLAYIESRQHREEDGILQSLLTVWSNVTARPDPSIVARFAQQNILEGLLITVLRIQHVNALNLECGLICLDVIDGLIQTKQLSLMMASQSLNQLVQFTQAHPNQAIRICVRILTNLACHRQNAPFIVEVLDYLPQWIRRCPTQAQLYLKLLSRVQHCCQSQVLVDAVEEVLYIDAHLLELLALLNKRALPPSTVAIICRRICEDPQEKIITAFVQLDIQPNKQIMFMLDYLLRNNGLLLQYLHRWVERNSRVRDLADSMYLHETITRSTGSATPLLQLLHHVAPPSMEFLVQGVQCRYRDTPVTLLLTQQSLAMRKANGLMKKKTMPITAITSMVFEHADIRKQYQFKYGCYCALNIIGELSACIIGKCGAGFFYMNLVLNDIGSLRKLECCMYYLVHSSR